MAKNWYFVDDQAPEARAFAEELSADGSPIHVTVLSPQQAKEQLLTGATTPDGVLMDVDLSAAVGEHGTGPGIAQDIRIKQRARAIPEYPIARFAALDLIKMNVEGDPTSDDLFDLKIQKEALKHSRDSVLKSLQGLAEVYEGLKDAGVLDVNAVPKLVGLTVDEHDRFSHSGFQDRMLSALQIATHVAASAFFKGFLAPTGLLIDERVLAIRLGIDAVASGGAWNELVATLPFKYHGVAGEYFNRWWARGLEEWWFDVVNHTEALSSLTIAQRIAEISPRVSGLVPMTMPQNSAGARPWRLCAISLEDEPQSYVPLDPLESVRFTPRVDQPAWVDSQYAALGPALATRSDFRLNRADMTRLQSKHQ